MAITSRKVLVQFISSHLHLEVVEVTVPVNQHSPGQFEGDLQEIEQAARARMLEKSETFGPWDDPISSFDMIAVLCAVTEGMDRGRIGYVAQVQMDTVSRWRTRSR